MKRVGMGILAGLWVGASAWGQAETHVNLQAVDADGVSVWTGAHPFTLRGVILNDPEEMLDGAWDADAESANRMGGQWQIFIQSVAEGDRGGTACWMGQNYSSLGPWIPAGNLYGETEWSNEMVRVNHDAASGHRFRKGDLVEVTANRSLFYGGKRNINESHRVTPANDFGIVLVAAGAGLPDPEAIRIADLMGTDDGDPATHEDIFDPARQVGGEAYQGMRVRIEGIRIATNEFGSAGWGAAGWGERRCTVTDGEGRFFTLRMPLADLGPVPADWFSATGILNQESDSGADGTFGYELFVQEIGPTLRMIADMDKLFVYWSGIHTNYVLEYATDPAGTSGWQRVETAPVKWLAVAEDPTVTGDPVRVYRLRQQE